MTAMVNQRWILIRNTIIYLEAKFRPNRRILYFGGHFRYKMATVANQRWISIRNIKSTWKPNFVQIGGFLYFGGHFGFKMATIANKNGRHMVQHVLLPVNIHFY